MTEKIITLEDVELVGFLGVENSNIKVVAEAFPQSKLISRGNEITIRGSISDIVKITEIIESMVVHFQKYGKITTEQVKTYLSRDKNNEEETPVIIKEDDDVLLYGTKGVVIRVKSPNQKKLIDAAAENDIVFAIGPAGTGKTYTAVALAVKALKNKEVKKIIITRPAVEAGEHLGFLPGTLNEKIDPYLRPLFDALHDMIDIETIPRMMQSGIIEVAPLAYMRGRTLNDAFIILDEAQNTTAEQMKMFLTRLGFGSKMVITGDVTQIDLPNGQHSGLRVVRDILKDIDDIAFLELTAEDVVRHRLIGDIVKAYDKFDEAKQALRPIRK